MVELIKFVVSQFAEKPELIDYDVAEKGNEVTVTVTLDESDMGKVIGRQGKIAKAMRTIVRAATPRGSKRYVVEIKEKGGNAVNRETEEEAADAENADAE